MIQSTDVREAPGRLVAATASELLKSAIEAGRLPAKPGLATLSRIAAIVIANGSPHKEQARRTNAEPEEVLVDGVHTDLFAL